MVMCVRLKVKQQQEKVKPPMAKLAALGFTRLSE